MTLAYIPRRMSTSISSVRSWRPGRLSPYIPATLSGHGAFENPEGNVSVVLVDSEELQVARALLVAALDRAGIEISRLHGFTPHITWISVTSRSERSTSSRSYFTEFIISPPSGRCGSDFELATNISLGSSPPTRRTRSRRPRMLPPRGRADRP